MMSDIIASPDSAVAAHLSCNRPVLVGVLPTGESFLFNVKELAEKVGDIGDPREACQKLLHSEQFVGFSVISIHYDALSRPSFPHHNYVVVEFDQVPEAIWPVGRLPFLLTADMVPHRLRSRRFDNDLKEIARWLRQRGLIAA